MEEKTGNRSACCSGALMSARSSCRRRQATPVTVQSGGHQTFTGFGAAKQTTIPTYRPPPRGRWTHGVSRPPTRRLLRLWVGSGPTINEGQYEEHILSSYVDTGSSQRSQAVVSQHCCWHQRADESEPTDDLSAYCAKIAQFILDIKK